MKLIIAVDAQALRHTRVRMTYSIVRELNEKLSPLFPDYSREFRFFVRPGDVVLGEDNEFFRWKRHKKKFKVSQDLYANPESIVEYKNFLQELDEAQNFYLVVSPEKKLLDVLAAKARVIGLRVSPFGKVFNFKEKPIFQDAVVASHLRPTRVYMDTDDSILDRGKSLARLSAELNKELLRKIVCLSKLNTQFQQITSRLGPTKELEYSTGSHEEAYAIDPKDPFVLQNRAANVVRMEGVLAELRSVLVAKGFPPSCYSEQAIYTSHTCCKLSAIYWDLMNLQSKGQPLPHQVLLFDDDLGQLDETKPEIAEACRQIRILGIELHLFWVRSAGLYNSKHFTEACEQLTRATRAVEPLLSQSPAAVFQPGASNPQEASKISPNPAQ